jgi:hypothetical protein
MISNERPSPYWPKRRQTHAGPPPAPKPHVPEETIRTERIQVERKLFVFALKDNPRGRLLRITEDVGGRRDTIIIPATGLEEFKRVLDEMVQTADETPPTTEVPGEDTWSPSSLL